jgi:DNA-binding NtrC family response regulator
LAITETTISDGDEPPGSGDGFHLLVMSPESFLSRPLPASGVVTLGRSSKCGVRIDDPLASREHARLHIAAADGNTVVAVEDAQSANGTRVRDQPIAPGELVPILPGEAVVVGATVLMVLRDRPVGGPRRLWSHVYFECRTEDECAQAGTKGTAFALARIRFKNAAPWTRVLPILARDLPAQHIFAAYGPKDYEILFTDARPGDPERIIEDLLGALREAGLDGLAALAWYPKDGRSSDALFAHAHVLLRRASGAPPREDGSSTPAAAMQRVREMAARAASSSINVLVLGETGVGKEVLARLVHRLSPRAKRPMVALNCAGLPETLIESELFGHEKGAFTGAVSAKIGLLESANGGTVFLDEIGDMPLALQSKLLRAIEAREVMPVGALRPRPIDVRFIAATNRDLEAATANGQFRSDLFYRLNGIILPIPPLCERLDEIPDLIASFINDACEDAGRTDRPAVADETLEHLRAYGWPGNIRELKNVIERALVLCDGPEIRPEHLPLEKMRPLPSAFLTPPAPVRAPGAERESTPTGGMPVINDPRKAAERDRIVAALATCVSNQTRAARLLGMSRRTFVSKLDYYGIPRPQKGAGVPPEDA